MEPDRLLQRLLELVHDDDRYFVSGSMSFLPRLDDYRLPKHDIDVAMGAPLRERLNRNVQPHDRLRPLRLHQVVLADASPLTRVWSPRTSFAHLDTPAGLLDLAFYDLTTDTLAFRLGPALRLVLPRSVLGRVATLTWRGVPYRAGPVELAFLPKAAAYVRGRTLPPHHVEDLRRLAGIVEWPFIEELLARGGVTFAGRRVRRLDPFTPEILGLATHDFAAHA